MKSVYLVIVFIPVFEILIFDIISRIPLVLQSIGSSIFIIYVVLFFSSCLVFSFKLFYSTSRVRSHMPIFPRLYIICKTLLINGALMVLFFLPFLSIIMSLLIISSNLVLKIKCQVL
jgi:hypothetical protein